ncbi:hypothetical protein TELCIR_07058 [Teladorsagia circumcincta]|uniref:Ig-like domain-containing protein n=1 Tax=Teladorsagia circumcincta TaxID=45464 RepID=A0A2G9ULC3_TELCI|nr:hypothetical protein TELCIR_07058 [Teladorsagia circumcincta]
MEVSKTITIHIGQYKKTTGARGQKLFGDAAQQISVRCPASVYGHLLDLVAKHTDHPSVLLFRQRFSHLAVEKHVNESSVVFSIGDMHYPVETLLAMILTNVRDFAETYAEVSLRDVISVPVFFTQAERLTIEKAAEIAKLNLLQLISGGTAAGLNYGVFRRKEVIGTPQRLLIHDMGAGKTVATLVEYKLAKDKYGKEPKMSDLGVGIDRSLGGLEMTTRLRDLLVEKFKQHYKSQEDITTSERSMAILFKEAERLKQVLSANLNYCAQVGSVHEDMDMRVHVTSDEFNQLIDDLTPQVATALVRALEMADFQMYQVSPASVKVRTVWTREGVAIDQAGNGDKYKLYNNDAILEVSNYNPSKDAGEYVCKVFHPISGSTLYRRVTIGKNLLYLREIGL